MSDRARVDVVAPRRIIVTALPLRQAARERLAELLEARVIDVREPTDRADLVLTPACSPQLIAALQRQYEGARVVVVELDDWEFDIELAGPVKRSLRSGAAAYVLADSIEELAAKIGRSPTGGPTEDDSSTAVHELPPGVTVDELIASFMREGVDRRVTISPDDRPDR